MYYQIKLCAATKQKNYLHESTETSPWSIRAKCASIMITITSRSHYIVSRCCFLSASRMYVRASRRSAVECLPASSRSFGRGMLKSARPCAYKHQQKSPGFSLRSRRKNLKTWRNLLMAAIFKPTKVSKIKTLVDTTKV